MSLIEVNWYPSRKELRNFGTIALIASALIALLLYVLKGLGIQWAAIIFAAGLTIFLSSLISLKLTRMIYLGLIMVTLPIGWAVSFALLASFYFLLLTPLGLIFRLIGRDPLRRKFDSTANSYWLPRRGPDSLDRYFHQF
ncbi:hypothetical protein ES703_95553 [subsurface metagenome]